MSWEAIISRTLGVLLIMVFIVGCSPLLANNNRRTVSTDLDDLVARLDATVEEGEYDFQPAAHDLVLFYSAGTDDLILENVVAGGTRNHFVFERPTFTDCTERSCVCLCSLSASNGYWQKSGDAPYLELGALTPVQNINDQGFTCGNLECRATAQQDLVFVDSRGVPEDVESYMTVINELVEIRNDQGQSEELLPIALDIPILLSSGISTGRDLFFRGSTLGITEGLNTRYDGERQSPTILRSLITNYKWSGGVALGASGYARSRQDERDRILRAPYYDIKFTKVKTQPNVVSVCPYGNCLFEVGTELAIEEGKAVRGLLQLQNQLREAITYMSEDLVLCINQAISNDDKELCFITLEDDFLNPLFSGTYDFYKPEIILRSNSYTVPDKLLSGPLPQDTPPTPVIPGVAPAVGEEPSQIVARIVIWNTNENRIIFEEEQELTFSKLLLSTLGQEPSEQPVIYIKDYIDARATIETEDAASAINFLSSSFDITSDFSYGDTNIYFKDTSLPGQGTQQVEEATS